MEVLVEQSEAKQGKVIREMLTFEDVMLVPKRSSVASRMDVNLATRLTRNIELNIPLVSANMNTVTESAMAICLAQEGGFGIIHRNLPIQREVEEVEKVKRSENTVIENPFTITAEDTIERALAVMEKHKISGLVVVNGAKIVEGILTNRDLLFEEGGKLVSEVMTKEVITSTVGSTSASQIELMKKYKVEKIPLVDENGMLKGLVTARDVLKKKEVSKCLPRQERQASCRRFYWNPRRL